MHALVAWARQVVESLVLEGRTPTGPEERCPEMEKRAGVFVSLKKDGALRGCIGTIGPVTESVTEEIRRNGIAAATQDPRFSPVGPQELGQLEYSVDVLGEPEAVTDRTDLDPRRFGVIVSKGGRRGLLLPDLEGVDTVDQQIAIAATKAGLAPDDPDLELQRFEVTRYK